jgi:alpha-tubulin suppressor-like RCC1 family protein
MRAMRAGSAPPIRGRNGYDDSPKVRTKASRKAGGDGIGAPSTIPRQTKTTPLPNHKKAVKRTVLQREEYDLELAQRQRSSCSLAMSRTETILVSASGDVICCRCRRSSTPFLSRTDSEGLEAWTIMPCCDTDACLDMAGQSDSPWSPVFDKLRNVNAGSASDTGKGNKVRSTKKQQQQEQQQEVGEDSAMSMYEWEKVDRHNPHIVTRQGLLGGAMAMPTPPKQTPIRTPPPPSQAPSLITTKESASFTSSLPSDYDGGIMPLPSFDYSHIHEQGHNDMVPPGESSKSNNNSLRRISSFSFPTIPETVPEEKKEDSATPYAIPNFVHGVPTFLSTLSQIRITQVSAHPLGAHVLLISAEALLFTYGLNNHGQLGMGTKSNVKDKTRGFSTTPTIITPLLENGGKAISCAAGVDHSLVVVSTEGRRIQKITRSPDNHANLKHGALPIARVTSYPIKLSYEEDDHDLNTLSSSEQDKDSSVQHHQLYAFGSNDFKKLGLISAAEDQVDEDVLLPRRVALHCTVWPQQKEEPPPKGSSSSTTRQLPPPGIFQVEASSEHSSALVRRATGDVEVYMWGNATLGALGLPLQPETTPVVPNRSRPTTTANNIFPLPTVLESLSCRQSTSETTSSTETKNTLDFPIQVALGSYCSFVVMSSGKVFSFGFSAEGMLGQGGGITHTMLPQQVCMPANDDGGIVSISAGAYHTLALTQGGRAYSWGINSNDRLGLGEEKDDLVKLHNTSHQHSEGVVLEWTPQPISVPTRTTAPTTTTGDADACHALQVCAGYDSSLLVMRSGSVLSFGKRSGRLGLGEVASDVASPKPMFGGLRLFTNVASLRKKGTST